MASWRGLAWMSRGSSPGSSSLTRCSTRSSSAAVIGFRMGEVEAQAVGCDQRASLADVLAEHRPQAGMEQVRGGVIAHDVPAADAVDG